MMLELLETGKALYALTAVCVLGLLSRLIARNLYKRLIKETENMTLTKNRFLRDLKQKAENTYRLNQGIVNTKVYLERQVMHYRFMGLSLSGWGNLSGQLTVLCFLLGGAAAFGAYWYRCDSYFVALYGSIGVLAGLLTLFLDYGVNLGEWKSQLMNTLQDYLENSLFLRLSRETAAAMDGNVREIKREAKAVLPNEDEEQEEVVRPQRRKSSPRLAKKGAYTESIRDVDYLRRSLEQIAASREKNPAEGEWVKNLSPKELELVGEILRQYLT